jgi:cell division protein FtsI/penicillin-binding protein 2
VADSILNWALRAILLVFGLGAALAILRWLVAAFRERREKWAARLGVAMVLLAGVYAAGHANLLLHREQIERGRAEYARFGDPRLAELNRAELRGWLLDCSGKDEEALARYGVRDGSVERVYPLGEAGANLVGGGEHADERDYTVERLFASRLREPLSWTESAELHPAGKDLQLTLCSEATREAWKLLEQTGRDGAVVVQDVRTGALVAYAATGGPTSAPLGIKRYAIPGSVFKLALSAMWWDAGLGDVWLPCPAYIQVGRRRIRNFESHEYPALEAPRKMLVVSCNTAAIQMGLTARERLGEQAIADAFRRFGFEPYTRTPPPDTSRGFWNTGNEAWRRRMTPPPGRVRFSQPYNSHEWGLVSIGQGPVDVTPIGVSRFLQAIGNDGVMYPVTLEEDRLGERGEGQRVMKESTARKLQQAMLQVVDSGTAVSTKPLLQGIGWRMGGKTGTADVQGQRTPNGWFAGLVFGPDGRPRYTVVVYVQQGGQGGRVPAGVAARLTRWFAAQANGGRVPNVRASGENG